MNKVLCVHSGGLDSTVLAYYLREKGFAVHCLGFNYGQRHHRELMAASQVAQMAGFVHEVADISTIGQLLGGNALTDDIEVPEGHYADQSMRQTVVPNRNLILLSVAAGRAIAIGAGHIAYGAHGGDHAIYPDCRPEFVFACQGVFAVCDYQPLVLLAPFLHRTKADIVRVGNDLGVPFALTWSCYKGDAKHCGRCGTCVERREAFSLACVSDPTDYE